MGLAKQAKKEARKNLDREEILSKITEWLTQMGLEFKSIEDPIADFHLAVFEPNLPPVDIVHPKIDSVFVMLIARILVSEEDQKKMLDMKFKQLEEFLWRIRLELLSMNVEFRMLRLAGGVPTAWEIHSKLFLRGAIAQHFSDLYLKVKNAVLYVVWSHRRTLDTLESTTQ